MNETSEKVCAEVVRRFPEMAGIEPAVSPLPNANQLFTFKVQSAAEDGAPISRIVKVTVDQKGNLLKVTSSRG